MPVPYTFGTATTSIPLSNLDANFNTPVTIGNTTVGLGNTVTTIGNLTLTNATISTGNVTVTTGIFGAGSNTAPSITTTGDTNTGIFFPAADTIAFTEGGTESMRIDASGNLGIGTSSPGSNGLSVNKTSGTGAGIQMYQSGTETFKVATDNSAAYVQAIANIPMQFYTNNTERMRITSTGYVGIANTAPPVLGYEKLGVTGSGAFSSTGSTVLGLWNTTNAGLIQFYTGGGTAAGSLQATGAALSLIGGSILDLSATGANPVTFGTNGAERMRIDSSGNVLIAKTAVNVAVAGFQAETSGTVGITRDGALCLIVNRNTDDGTLISLRQANTEEGNISVSGSTVSYNGGHLSRWSQLPDGSKDESIVKGTVMSNLDDMCVWEKEGVVAENEQLNKMKVSDVEGDTNVAGVFVNWTVDEQYGVDDMNVAMTGDMIIRIADDVVVQKGDLLMSAGDGTAKPQGDDIVRSKTIAKVTSNYVTCTYADGSYCVPCVLMAC